MRRRRGKREWDWNGTERNGTERNGGGGGWQGRGRDFGGQGRGYVACREFINWLGYSKFPISVYFHFYQPNRPSPPLLLNQFSQPHPLYQVPIPHLATANYPPGTIAAHKLAQTASACGDEAQVRLAGPQHAAQILGVELHADKPRMVAQLEDLHAFACVVLADEGEAVRG